MTLLRSTNNRNGYSLVELLVVITIIALLTAAGGPAFSALTSTGGNNQNIAQLTGILEQAREYAVAQNTYVWVAFTAPSTAAAGYSQVSVAVVASTDGTDPGVITSSGGPSTPFTLTSANLALISKIVTLKQVNLQVAYTYNHTNLPSLPANPTGLSDPANSLCVSDTTILSGSGTGFFSLQIPGTSTTANFTKAVEFTPSGQARNATSPIDVIDIGMQPQKGTAPDTKNISVLRVNGLTGETAVYRP